MTEPNKEHPSVKIVYTVCTCLTTVIVAFIGYQQVKLNVKATESVKANQQVAAKADAVKETLERTTTLQDEKLDKIHTLVNSNMGAALKLIAEYARSRAEQSVGNPKHEEYEAAAVAAEAKYQDHVAQQAKVDAGKKKP